MGTRLGDLTKALETRLDSTAGIPTYIDNSITKKAIVWPNVKFDYSVAEYFIAPHIMPSQSSASSFGDEQRDVGLMQVSIYGPTDKGMAQFYELADNIYDHFNGQLLELNDVCAKITKVQIEKPMREDGRMLLPISIYYDSYST